MPKLDIADIDALISASTEYNKKFNTDTNFLDDKLGLAPGLMSYAEFASQIRGAEDEIWMDPHMALSTGTSVTDALEKKQRIVYGQGEMDDQAFVLGYIFDPKHPERLPLRHRLSEAIPEDLTWKAEGTGPGMLNILGSPFEDMAWNLLSVPSGVTQTMSELFALPASLSYVDWKNYGKLLFKGETAIAMHELDKGYTRFVRDRDKRLKRGISEPVAMTADGLSVMSDMLSDWAQRGLDYHKEDAHNRAYWKWAATANEKDWFGAKGKTKKEWFNFAWDAFSSPLLIGGATVVGGALGGPSVALNTGMLVGGGMEYADERNQAYDYFRERGYSKRNANQAANATGLGYSLIAMGIERTSLKVFMNQSMNVKDMKVFNSAIMQRVVKGTSDAIDKIIMKTDDVATKVNIKKIADSKFAKVLRIGTATGVAGAFEETSQSLAQAVIKSGYMGEKSAFDDFHESFVEVSQKGAIGEAGAGLAYKALGMRKGGKKGKSKADTGPTKVDDIPVTRIDKDKVKVSILLRLNNKSLSDNEKQIGADLTKEDKTPESIIKSIEKKGKAILSDLSISEDKL